MARKCSICEHPKRKQIDKSLVEPNAQLRTIALRYGVSKYALKRHVDGGHIAEKIKKVGLAMEAVEADDFLTHLQKRKARFTEMAEDAKKAGDPILELKVYTAEGKFVEMEGRALGAFREKIEHSGPGGAPLTPKQMSDEQIIDLIRKERAIK